MHERKASGICLMLLPLVVVCLLVPCLLVMGGGTACAGSWHNVLAIWPNGRPDTDPDYPGQDLNYVKDDDDPPVYDGCVPHLPDYGR